MKEPQQFEIPEAMRDMAERNVEQARQAYDQFLEAARKAQEMTATSSSTIASSMQDLQLQAMKFAEANMDASFNFASQLSKVRDLKEMLEMQQTFAKKQMDTYGKQAQELTRLMAETAQKSQKR